MSFLEVCACTINSKINGTPIDVSLPISQLHSILVVAKLLAHNNLMVMLLWASQAKKYILYVHTIN